MYTGSDPEFGRKVPICCLCHSHPFLNISRKSIYAFSVIMPADEPTRIKALPSPFGGYKIKMDEFHMEFWAILTAIKQVNSCKNNSQRTEIPWSYIACLSCWTTIHKMLTSYISLALLTDVIRKISRFRLANVDMYACMCVTESVCVSGSTLVHVNVWCLLDILSSNKWWLFWRLDPWQRTVIIS